MDENEQRNRQRTENLLRELKSRMASSKFDGVLRQKVEWLRSLNVKVAPISARLAIEMENIKYGGKVVWEKGSIPKKPMSLKLNILDFDDMHLITIFLHECGHIKDKDDNAILLETPESELSAWNHAINDLNQLSVTNSEKLTFREVMKRALLSYRIEERTIATMISQIQ